MLEYLSCQLPVLASELKAHREMAKKLNGIAIYKSADDVLKVMKKNAKVPENARGLDEYSWDTIVNTYESVWESN